MSKSGPSFGLIFFIVLILAGAGVGGYFYWKNGAEKPPEINSVTVSKGDVVQAVTATGDVQPVTSIDVSSQISGLITEVLVDYNTPVTKDQILAKIDPATYEQRVKQAKADLEAADANHTLVRLNTERTRELRTKNLVSQQELDQGEAQLAQAHSTLLTRTAALDDAKVNLERCTIRAPMDGTVLSRDVEIGKTVAASLNAPTLFVIVNDLTKMQIDAAVAEADVGNVEVDQRVTFTVDAFPSRQFRGRVSQIRNSPKTNQNVVTYDTIIDVRNDDLKLKPGMTANVSVVIAQRNAVLRVSNAALRARIPEQFQSKIITDPPPAAANGDAKAAAPAKPMTEEERRKVMRDLMREAGFVPGSGPPSPEIFQKVQELAKQRGIELDFGRWGGGNRGGNSGSSNAPTTRTVYKLLNSDPKNPQIKAVTVKLGISDGITTEVIDGLAENDVLVTSITGVGLTTAPAGGAANPFAPRSPFGGPAGGGRR